MENKKVSCMYALPLENLKPEYNLYSINMIEEALKKDSDFNILSIEKYKNQINAKIVYKEKNYELTSYFADFSSEQLKDFMYSHIFTEEEKKLIKDSKQALITKLDCNGDPLNAYHLQLKIISNILQKKLLAVYDSDSIRILSGKWVEKAASSSVTPSALYLFSIHAVSDLKTHFVWLHTHGLSRYGLNELDILDSQPDFCMEHSILLQNLAVYLLTGGDKDCAYIGILQENTPLICDIVTYKDAADYYIKNNKNIPEALSPDNKHTDESHRAVFVFTSPQEYNEKKFKHINIFDKNKFENPIYFISYEEMERMKILAKERFSFVKTNFKTEASSVLIKISIPLDKVSHSLGNETEYVWFELQDISGSELKLKSIQDSYYLNNIQKETITKFDIENMSDWIIYREKEMITPDDVYRL